MSKITSRVNALRGCVINWCEDQEEKQTMIMCADEVLEYIDKLEKQQEFQLTVEEIDYILNYPKEINILKRASIFNKLRKQREMLRK